MTNHNGSKEAHPLGTAAEIAELRERLAAAEAANARMRALIERAFNGVGLVPHADIQWHPIARSFARWAAVGRILKRRKKRFDIIVAPDERWRRALQRLAWWHRARVVPADHTEELQASWNTSRSQSSS